MTAVQTFDFDENPVRVIEKDGEPWFVAADVCRVLELTNPTVALESLDDDERAKFNLGRCYNGGGGETNIISESGLYILILRCRDAIKKGTVPYRFRKWVTGEVLPSIRKTGRYELPADDGEDDGADRTDVLPDRSTSQWLKMIRETRLLYGRNAAREMWTRSPLPKIGIETPDCAPKTSAEETGRRCLAILTDAAVSDGSTVRDLVRQNDDEALKRCGMRFFYLDGRKYLAVSNRHPFLDKLFRSTAFAFGGYRRALRGIVGALTGPVIRIGRDHQRCTLIPAEII
mgnify:FL=1